MGFFSTFLLENAVTAAAPITTGPVDVTLMLLARAPELEDVETRYAFKGVTTPESLVALDGWEEISAPGYSRQVNAGCTIYTKGSNQYLIPKTDILTFSLSADTQVEALALLVDGTKLGGSAGARVICVTTTPFAKDPILRDGDRITALTDSTIGKKWYVGWSTTDVLLPVPATVFKNAAEGTTVLWQGPPKFESSRIQHVWLSPQRVNFIANPSFEYTQSVSPPAGMVIAAVGREIAPAIGKAMDAVVCLANVPTPISANAYGSAFNATVTPANNKLAGYWQTNSYPLRLIQGEEWAGYGSINWPSPKLSANAQKMSRYVPQYDPESRLYIKSSPFYPTGHNFTFQLLAKGRGIARVGLAYYARDYVVESADWGMQDNLVFQEWTLSSDHYTSLRGLRFTDDRAYEVALIIEVRGYLTNPDNPSTYVTPEIILDNCLVEEGELLDWPYFDGDSTYAAPGDYSWYGGTSQAGKSYSLWYNNRKSVSARLFGRFVDDDALYTNRDEQLDSLLSEWVPTGTQIVPHWDVLKPGDTQLLPENRASVVLPASLWPEQSQKFSIYNVESDTDSAVIQVIGEGAFPVTRGFVYTEGSTSVQPLTIAPRPWEAPGLRQYQIDALKSQLYDLSVAQEISVSWAGVPAFSTNHVYLERGTSSSPQSWASFTLVATAAAGYDIAEGIAYRATASVSAPVSTTSVTGTALDAVARTSFAAGLASGSAQAFSPGWDNATSGQVLASSTASAFDAVANTAIEVVTAVASATGTAYNSGANSSPTADSAAGIGTALDGSTNLLRLAPAETAVAVAATGAAGAAADVNIDMAATTGTGYTGSTAIGALAEQSAATGAAYDVSQSVANTADSASATGSAADAQSSITFSVGSAAATTAAADAQSNLAPPVETAAASSTAYDIVDEIDAVSAGVADSVATAYQPNTSVVVTSLETATASSTAYDLVDETTALTAETATGVAIGYTPGTNADTTIPVASGSGTAVNPASQVDTSSTTGIGSGQSFSVSFDTVIPTPTIISFQPETSYGQMVLRWTNGTDVQTYLDTVLVEASDNGTTWTTVANFTADGADTLAGSAMSIVVGTYAAPAAGTSDDKYARVTCTDKAGNSASSTASYVLIPSPINVVATATNSWRNTNGGEWNSQANNRVYQWYFTNAAWNAIGCYFYDNNISKWQTTYNGTAATASHGVRTASTMRILFTRDNVTGSSVGHEPVIRAHKIVSNPGNVTGYAEPTLYDTETSTGLSLGLNTNGFYTLPASYRDGLFNGTYEGIAHRDTTSGVYAAYYAVSENALSGMIEINHLG
jgi:hypothetical protein